MQKQLYLIDYECAHWCGGQSHCVVWAENEDDAEDLAAVFMEEHMRDLYSSEYDDEYDEENMRGHYDDESAVQVNSVTVMDEQNPHWEYYMDADQAEFYPVIGTPE